MAGRGLMMASGDVTDIDEIWGADWRMGSDGGALVARSDWLIGKQSEPESEIGTCAWRDLVGGSDQMAEPESEIGHVRRGIWLADLIRWRRLDRRLDTCAKGSGWRMGSDGHGLGGLGLTRGGRVDQGWQG